MFVGKSLSLVFFTFNCFLPFVLSQETLVICVFVRNKANYLPFTFGGIDKLKYPKHKTVVWIASDHNTDNSTEVAQKWADGAGSSYKNIVVDTSFDGAYNKYSENNHEWPSKRMSHLILTRERCLSFAFAQYKAHYLLSIDGDNIIIQPRLINSLIECRRPIISPSLMTANSYYRNFWGAMDPNTGFYRESENYNDIVLKKTTGCLPVALVHSTILFDLSHPNIKSLSYRPVQGIESPLDDMILMARSADRLKIGIYIDNRYDYGMMPPVFKNNHQDMIDLDEMMLYMANGGIDVPRSIYLPSNLDNFGFDKIFVINLERRIHRRQIMEKLLTYLRIDAEFIKAEDGQKLTQERLDDLGVKMLEGYSDPHHKRPMKMGEIGCFLSHYFLWQRMVTEGLQKVLILEDDIKFLPGFRTNLEEILGDDLPRTLPEWELLYLGRKPVYAQIQEYYVKGTERLVFPGYSYWTLAYSLTLGGAKKLLSQAPLGKMVAVDEFLPIMYNSHDNQAWAERFEPRNLMAVSIYPVLVEPMFYTAAEGYVSDTEDSEIIDDDEGEVFEEDSSEGEVVETEREEL